jgi:hypothetical protein
VITAAIWAAVDTASVDRTADEPERVAFNPAALDRVVRFYRDPVTKELVKEAWRTVFLECLMTRQDVDQALVAITLRDRLTGSTGRRYQVRADGSMTGSSLANAVDESWEL